MIKNEMIEKGLREKDLSSLREALGQFCYVNRSFSSSEFDSACEYVERRLKESGLSLMEPLKGELVSAGKTGYSEDDFARAVMMLKQNFSKERIDDVKKIGRALYTESDRKRAEDEKKAREKEKTSTGRTTGKASSNNSRELRGKPCPKAGSHQNEMAALYRGLVAIALVAAAVIAFLMRFLR